MRNLKLYGMRINNPHARKVWYVVATTKSDLDFIRNSIADQEELGNNWMIYKNLIKSNLTIENINSLRANGYNNHDVYGRTKDDYFKRISKIEINDIK